MSEASDHLPSPPLRTVREALRRHASPTKARILQGFFKTGPGEYGEGDVFIGVTVPQTRSVARRFNNSGNAVLRALLKSGVHEERLLALILLVDRFSRAAPNDKRAIFDFYLANSRFINNWDLVDLSAPNIVGDYLATFKNRSILRKLAGSANLWERRIAIVSTHALIRLNEFDDTLAIARLLLNDGEDLIHKAVGWMLREVGKRNVAVLETFLAQHYRTMPRTMLRYAIERFPETRRQAYLKGLA